MFSFEVTSISHNWKLYTTVLNREKGIRNEPTWTNIDSYILMHRKWKFIEIKIIQPGLFWLDQNCGFSYSKIDCFMGLTKWRQKTINFTIKKSTILIQSKKPWLNDFNFDEFSHPIHWWVWINVGSLGSIHDPWSALETPVSRVMFSFNWIFRNV